MQVSYSSDHVTHAIIGGGETINFGISNSAEFFNILSSTLYKDQKLAVVREVLCNAWDANIEAGCTDKAIVITLLDNKLVVKDSGKGIHHDDIGLIYGTYGNSTKKNDGKQTGGFGLGCKAPFAYTEHFEVTSSHEGVRTIYAMSKSSAQVGGKPGITTIAQFPTTETGLTVSIKIQEADVKDFKELIKRIAFNGDMNVNFNGEQLDTIEFDVQSSNWVVTGIQGKNCIDTNDMFLVRYGNVIYPIDETHKELLTKAQHIEQILKQMRSEARGYFWSMYLLFQAPAHSIAVTPSRESLSMQDHTIKTIDKLFTDFLDQIKASYLKDREKNVSLTIMAAVADKKVDSLLNVEPVLPGVFLLPAILKFKASSVNELAKQSIVVRYPNDTAFRTADVSLRVREMSKAGLIPRGLASTYLKEVQKRPDNVGCSIRSLDKTKWLQRKVIGKLATKLVAAGLETSKLRVYDKNMETVRSDGMSTMTKAKPRNIFNCLPYLQNVIVLTSSVTDLNTRVALLTNAPIKTTHLSGFMFYVFGRKKGEKEAVQEFFAKSGMTVLDMSVLEAPATSKDTSVTAVGKPRLKGLRELSNALDHPTSSFRLRADTLESDKRIENPKFVVQHSKYSPSYKLDDFSSEASVALACLFGTECGVCTTSIQMTNWTKKLPAGMKYVETKVLDFVKGSTAIQNKLSTSSSTILSYIHTFDNSYALSNLVSHGIISRVFVTGVVLTNEEMHCMTLFLKFLASSADFKTAAGPLADITLRKDFKAFIDKAHKSTLLRLLDMGHMSSDLSKPDKKQKALDLFNHALNN